MPFFCLKSDKNCNITLLFDYIFYACLQLVRQLSQKGDIGLFITLVPKLLLDFDWLVHEVKCPNVPTTNCNLQNV